MAADSRKTAVHPPSPPTLSFSLSFSLSLRCYVSRVTKEPAEVASFNGRPDKDPSTPQPLVSSLVWLSVSRREESLTTSASPCRFNLRLDELVRVVSVNNISSHTGEYIPPLVCLFSGRSGGGGGQLGSRCNFFMTLKRYVLNAKRICTRLGSHAVLSGRNETKRNETKRNETKRNETNPLLHYMFFREYIFYFFAFKRPTYVTATFYSLPLSGITFPPHYKFLFVDGTGWRKSIIVLVLDPDPTTRTPEIPGQI